MALHFGGVVTKKVVQKIEIKLYCGDARSAWQGLNTMMGRNTRQDQLCVPDDPNNFANDLNKFYARFDNDDFSENCNRICHAICTNNVENINIKDEEVTACFRRVNPNKSPGPDGLHGRVLKTCATQLGPIFARIF